MVKSVKVQSNWKHTKHCLQAQIFRQKSKQLHTVKRKFVSLVHSHGRKSASRLNLNSTASVTYHQTKWNESKLLSTVNSFFSANTCFYVSIEFSLWFGKSAVCLIFKMDDDCLSFRLQKSKSIWFYFTFVNFFLFFLSFSPFIPIMFTLDCNIDSIWLLFYGQIIHHIVKTDQHFFACFVWHHLHVAFTMR